MTTCGDFGGRNKRGEPCERALSGAKRRCYLHPASSEAPIPLRLIETASDDEPFPLDGLAPAARRQWETMLPLVDEHELGELYLYVLAFNAHIRSGVELAEHGVTVTDKAHGNDRKANPAALQLSRVGAELDRLEKRLGLADRVRRATRKPTGLELIQRRFEARERSHA